MDWGERRGSNPQPPEPQSGALPLSYAHHTTRDHPIYHRDDRVLVVQGPSSLVRPLVRRSVRASSVRSESDGLASGNEGRAMEQRTHPGPADGRGTRDQGRRALTVVIALVGVAVAGFAQSPTTAFTNASLISGAGARVRRARTESARLYRREHAAAAWGVCAIWRDKRVQSRRGTGAGVRAA